MEQDPDPLFYETDLRIWIHIKKERDPQHWFISNNRIESKLKNWGLIQSKGIGGGGDSKQKNQGLIPNKGMEGRFCRI